MTEEANDLIRTTNQMMASLDNSQRRNVLDEHENEVYYPLKECIAELKQRHNTVKKAHHERSQHVKSKLCNAQQMKETC